MMAPLNRHPSAACTLTGDADNDPRPTPVAAVSLEDLDGVRRRWRLGDVVRLADFVPKVLAGPEVDRRVDDRPVVVVPPRVTPAWEQAAAGWPDRWRLLGPPSRWSPGWPTTRYSVRWQLRRRGSHAGERRRDRGRPGRAFPWLARRLGSPSSCSARAARAGRARSCGRPSASRRYRRQRPVRPAARLRVRRRTVPSTWRASSTATGSRCCRSRSSPAGSPSSGRGTELLRERLRAAADLPSPVRAEAYEYGARVGVWLREHNHRGLFGSTSPWPATGWRCSR